MIALTFALPAESSAFVRKLKNVRRDAAILRGYLERSTTHKENAEEICVVHTGVGAAECKKRLDPFLKQEQPRVLISSGFCGGTSDEVAPGNVVIGENFSDAKLVEEAKKVLAGAIVGRLFSGAQVIDSAADRYEVGREHDAIAMDMETETVVQECARRGIPMLSLRVVSDSPVAPFPAPPDVLFNIEKQRTEFWRLLIHVAQNPARPIRLARFSKQIALAKKRLAEALCAVIPVL